MKVILHWPRERPLHHSRTGQR